MNGWPVTNYQMGRMKKHIAAAALVILAVFVLGNIIAAVFVPRVRVDAAGYAYKEGVPLFTSAEAYIRLVKSYPHDFGTKVKVHCMRKGESFWDVARTYNIAIDTLIAANPFLKSLMAEEGMEIAVPLEDGVLMPFASLLELRRMYHALGPVDSLKGDYIHSPFRLISPDAMRFAFFKGARPVIVNNYLQRLYNIKIVFQTPIKGLYSSFYGDRVDPMLDGTRFHNGLDIQSRMGAPIKPARDGIVTYTGWYFGYGLTVTVQHRDGYISMYGHCSSIKVKPGDRVTQKDVIGYVGSTGRSTGPHLHFIMMRHGSAINPLFFVW